MIASRTESFAPTITLSTSPVLMGRWSGGGGSYEQILLGAGFTVTGGMLEYTESRETNLSTTRDATTVTIVSSTGSDALIPAATSEFAGAMSATQAALLGNLGNDSVATFSGVAFKGTGIGNVIVSSPLVSSIYNQTLQAKNGTVALLSDIPAAPQTSDDIAAFLGSADNAEARTKLGVLPLTGGTLTGDLTINKTGAPTRLHLISNLVEDRAPELWYWGLNQTWISGIDVSATPDGCDFVPIAFWNPVSQTVTDWLYVNRNKTGGGTVTDESGSPTISLGVGRHTDPATAVVFDVGAPPTGPHINRDVVAIRASGTTAKLFATYDGGGVRKTWIDSQHKWNNLKVVGNASFDGHQVIRLENNSPPIQSTTTYTDLKAAVGLADPLMTLVLTPGYWEIGGQVLISNASAAAGGKLWMKFAGDINMVARYFNILACNGTAGADTKFFMVAPSYDDPGYIEVSLPSTQYPRFCLQNTVFRLFYDVKISFGFSQAAPTAADTVALGNSTVWAKYLKD